jgi:LacI family transcriptional regulator
MPKFDQIAQQVKAQILDGQHGGPGDRFMTVRELAERFGVALTTAQKVLKQLKDEGLLIADSTSPAKISPAVASAEADARGGSGPKRIGLVVTDLTNPFFSRVSRHIQQVASEEGYQVLVTSSESEFERERRLIDGFLEIGVEGLLVCPGLDDACVSLYRRLIDRGVRLSFVSRRVEGIEADFVVAHNFVGGASMAGHLLSVGYKSFGYIAFGPRLKRDERLRGYRSALVEEGFELGAEEIVHGDGRDIAHGYRAMHRLMDRGRPPRAVFSYNDLLAIGALRYCQEQGIAVPADVAIAGFDNLPECRVTSPPLTSVAYPIQSIARLAVRNLIDRVEGTADRPPHRILLEPHVVVRESTDPRAEDSHSPAASREDASNTT